MFKGARRTGRLRRRDGEGRFGRHFRRKRWRGFRAGLSDDLGSDPGSDLAGFARGLNSHSL
jgi:hypothetical protein